MNVSTLIAIPVWVTFRAVTQATPARAALPIASRKARVATTMPNARSPSSIAVEGVSRRTSTVGLGLSSPPLIMLT